MNERELEKYLGSRVGVSTNSGRFLFGHLIEIEDFAVKIQFLNKARILTVPVHSIVSIKLLDDKDE